MTRMHAVSVFAVSVVIGGIASSLYFSFHAPGALELSLQTDLGVTSDDIGDMFTVYSIPNMIMPLLAGIAIDRIGLKRVGFVLLTLVNDCIWGLLIADSCSGVLRLPSQR